MNACISNSPAAMLANAILSKAATGLWIISGPSGSGKTQFCSETIARAQEAGVTVGGFICPAVFESGQKIGIDMLAVASGERRRLGTRSQNQQEATVGCWHLEERVIDWGNQILADLRDEAIIVIDELGPLELEDGYGYQEALRLLDEKRYRTALIVVRLSLLPLAGLRWPDAQVLKLTGEAA